MKLARFAAAGALVLTASLGLAGAANAGTSSCPSGSFCFWNLQSYSGTMGHFAGDNADWSIYKTTACTSGSWSNCAESAYNHGTQCTVYMFDATGSEAWRYGYHSLARGDSTPNMFGDYLNKVSSNRWCSPK
ncbi:peptidase inhibitor family I36 protein [Intrasporangium sp. YIM S08009]|uniref:peptidase inhibitor family I36 protein n=1 Tax=Intrasporangium zincisolvens TaxID=3080018 RepID=UPI002B0621CE|nr:peptidase inhibitor family I36 protein [Intrasporangium sp. YIM S08009]